MNATPAGWYPDPTNPLQERLWDGSEWIDRVRVRAPVPAAQPVSVEMPPPPPVQQPVVHSAPPPEYDYKNRVKVVMSTLWVYWFAAHGYLISGFLVGMFAILDGSWEYISPGLSLISFLALVTLIVSGIRHSRVARHTYSFMPSPIVSLAVIVGSLVLTVVTQVSRGTWDLEVNAAMTQSDQNAYLMSQILSTLTSTVPIGLVLLLQLGGLFNKDRRSVVLAGLGAFLLVDAMIVGGDFAASFATTTGGPFFAYIVGPWILLTGLWKVTPAYGREQKEIVAVIDDGGLSQAELLDISLKGSVAAAIAAVSLIEDSAALKTVIRTRSSHRVVTAARKRQKLLKKQKRKSLQ
jgi:uncharacterized protein with PQ loop repeat